jgi:hypothetical protein
MAIDPKFVRSPKAEANAIARGMTKEEIDSRGGISASGYYGDSWSSKTNLTDAEYAEAAKGGGAGINSATNAKRAASGATNTSGNSASGLKSDAQIEADAAAAAEEKLRKGQSAFDFLKLQFSNLGIGDLIAPLEELIKEGISSDEMTLRLMNDPKYNKAYKTRFSANDARIAAGLRALSPAEYVGLEDKYQEVMRQSGLPESYYAKDATGKQIGFEKLIANDISNLELQDRIGTAQKRVLNANPEVTQALKQFYPDITNADILAYTLDPKNAIENIKRKVTSAEIGGAAIQSGLGTSLARAEELQRYGVDKAAATAGFATIGAGLQRGSELASIYQQDPYTQTTAESEIFNVPGAKEARKQRQKITGLEKATFGGQTGITSGALARDRAGGY